MDARRGLDLFGGGQSQKFMQEYETMADMLFEEGDADFTLARINAANKQNQAITAHYKVKSFPHLFYFHKQVTTLTPLATQQEHTHAHTHTHRERERERARACVCV